MEKLFSQLAIKCLKHGLRFEYIPASNGVEIMSGNYLFIGRVWLDDQDPVKELNWLNTIVDNHIEGMNYGKSV